ncbi:MAG: ribosome maturation factor RimP [Acidimicrobiales bacterium]
MSVIERVRAIVEPLLSDRDLELFDVEQSGSVLRITVDRPGGVGLDDLGETTRSISRALDEHDPLPGRYTLEVSSPGVERPLRTPTHFARAVGEKVAVRTHPGVDPRRIGGVLTAADDGGITVKDDDGSEVGLRYADIERARTVYEWGGPAPKPGKTTKTSKKAATT